MILLALGAAGPPDALHLEAAALPSETAADLKDLSVDEIRRRLATLESEASAALAEEDYDLAARLRRAMAPLEAEILRREREGTPTRPPNFRTPRP